jgi:hypothetical protein
MADLFKEKRKAARKRLRYTAWVALSAEERHGCVLSDVSESGARIDVQDSNIVPDCFVLMLTNNGAARRYCRVMWRKPTQIGVRFARSLAEAAQDANAPKADANAKAAPAASAPAPDAAEPAKTA